MTGWRTWDRVKVINVVDGDTIDADIDMGFYVNTRQRLRLYGVNTPERGQPGYAEAKNFIVSISSQVTKIETLKADKYGRFLAILYTEAGSVNGMLVEQGLAVPYMI